jgi:hypothetical protein
MCISGGAQTHLDAASTHFEALYAGLGLLMDNTLAQSLLNRAQSVSEHHPSFFSGKDGSGQGQITDNEKKKQAIQKQCCNNNYMLTKCCWQS